MFRTHKTKNYVKNIADVQVTKNHPVATVDEKRKFNFTDFRVDDVCARRGDT